MNQSLMRAHAVEEIKAAEQPFVSQETIECQGFSKKDEQNATLLMISLAIGGLGCILALIAELF